MDFASFWLKWQSSTFTLKVNVAPFPVSVAIFIVSVAWSAMLCRDGGRPCTTPPIMPCQLKYCTGYCVGLLVVMCAAGSRRAAAVRVGLTAMVK